MRALAWSILLGGVLALSACGRSSVGNACTTDNDCDNGQTCYTALPGGYCSKGCTIEGTSKECPGGTVCSNEGNLLLCAPICKAQGDCRTEYECNGTSGPDKACRPKP